MSSVYDFFITWVSRASFSTSDGTTCSEAELLVVELDDELGAGVLDDDERDDEVGLGDDGLLADPLPVGAPAPHAAANPTAAMEHTAPTRTRRLPTRVLIVTTSPVLPASGR